MIARSPAMTENDIVYVRTAPSRALSPPITSVGFIGWLRANLFSSWLNTALTLLTAALIVWLVPPIVRFLFIDAL